MEEEMKLSIIYTTKFCTYKKEDEYKTFLCFLFTLSPPGW